MVDQHAVVFQDEPIEQGPQEAPYVIIEDVPLKRLIRKFWHTHNL